VNPRVTNSPQSSWQQWAPGVRVRHLVDGEGTSLALYHVEPGTRCEMHAHPSAELGMILSGKGALLFEDEEKWVDAGDSFYLPGGLRHGFWVPPGWTPVLMINVEAGATPTHTFGASRPRVVEPARSPGRAAEPASP
jgi:quercetin dioxygenase-like cupin family protein